MVDAAVGFPAVNDRFQEVQRTYDDDAHAATKPSKRTSNGLGRWQPPKGGANVRRLKMN
jgi:hypothetical protein